jgi:hypothetical protein
MCGLADAAHDVAMRITIDIDSADPLDGTVTLDDGTSRTFAGWLQLMTQLDRVVTAAFPVDSAAASPYLGRQLSAVGDAQLGEHV